MIRKLEELSLNAWGALQTVLYDGWLLRFANGYTRRANSIQTLYPSTLNLEEKIDYCEQLYSSRGLNTVFKLTGMDQPPELEVALVERGYVLDAPTSVQTRRLDSIPTPQSKGIMVEKAVSESWLADFCRLSDTPDRHLPTMRMMLANIMPTSGFFRRMLDNQTVAIGLGVIEQGYISLYNIATAEHFRKQGHGTLLILNILNWAQEHGAHTANLGVMQDNLPALNLYQKLGFREVYRYWYRQKEL